MSKKARTKIDIGPADMYKFFKKNYDFKITAGEYAKILKALNAKFIENIYEGELLELPYTLGSVYVSRSKPTIKFKETGEFDVEKSTIATDWGETNKLWKEKPELAHKTFLVYENFHTGGYKMRIKWNKAGAYVRNINMYVYVPARSFKRGLASYIQKTNKLDYYDN